MPGDTSPSVDGVSCQNHKWLHTSRTCGREDTHYTQHLLIYKILRLELGFIIQLLKKNGNFKQKIALNMMSRSY